MPLPSLKPVNGAAIPAACQIASKTDPGFASKIDSPMKAISAYYSGFV